MEDMYRKRILDVFIFILFSGSVVRSQSQDQMDLTKSGIIEKGDFNASTNHISFKSGQITRVLEGATTTLELNITCQECLASSLITFEVQDVNILEIGSSNATLTHFGDDLYSASVNVTGIFLGMTSLRMTIVSENDVIMSAVLMVFVSRKQSMIDELFNWLLTAFLILANVTFGCEIDLLKVKGYFKKPVGILTGLFCQYGLMPALAVASSILGNLNNVYAFGLLAYGCSPGGGNSNVLTVLLGGEINLSITMTFTSFIFSFAFMPLWLYTVGKRFSSEDAQIPFTSIIMYLAFLFIPTCIGIAIRRCKKSVADRIVKYLRPVIIVVIICLTGLGMYVSRFVFTLMAQLGYKLVLPCVAIPCSGFLISLAFALIVRQSWTCAKTISIETGVQNMTIAIVLLRQSLPSPESEISSVPPLIAGGLGTLPLLFCVFARKIFLCVQTRYCPPEENENDLEKDGTTNPGFDEVDKAGNENKNDVLRNHEVNDLHNHNDDTQKVNDLKSQKVKDNKKDHTKL